MQGTQSTGLGSRFARGLMMGVAVVALTACTVQYRNHGYVPTELALAEVQVGVDTRETVLDQIGTPTAGGVLGQSDFYYVNSRFRHFAWFEPEEVDRQLLAISFDEAGTVRNIETFGLEDGRVVVLSRRVTDDNIRDMTFIRQLLGNIGNFDAGSFVGEGPDAL